MGPWGGGGLSMLGVSSLVSICYRESYWLGDESKAVAGRGSADDSADSPGDDDRVWFQVTELLAQVKLHNHLSSCTHTHTLLIIIIIIAINQSMKSLVSWRGIVETVAHHSKKARSQHPLTIKLDISSRYHPNLTTILNLKPIKIGTINNRNPAVLHQRCFISTCRRVIVKSFTPSH